MKCGALLAVLLATTAHAQVYKCTVNGRTVIADAPCAPHARPADALEDNVPVERQIDRLRLDIKERHDRNRIEARDEAQYRADQRALSRQVANENQHAAAQRARCAQARADAARARRSAAFYQDLGMQRSLSNREAAAKAADERAWHECD